MLARISSAAVSLVLMAGVALPAFAGGTTIETVTYIDENGVEQTAYIPVVDDTDRHVFVASETVIDDTDRTVIIDGDVDNIDHPFNGDVSDKPYMPDPSSIAGRLDAEADDTPAVPAEAVRKMRETAKDAAKKAAAGTGGELDKLVEKVSKRMSERREVEDISDEIRQALREKLRRNTPSAGIYPI